jgi:response regulator RpfG family c-di-GMP phosphodiesterase
MKITPEIANVINVVTKDKETQKKNEDERTLSKVADIVSVENKQASRSRVENVEEAKQLLADVTKQLESTAVGLYNINSSRVSRIIS